MRKNLFFAVAILELFVATNAIAVQDQERITIPEGTLIPARLASQLDSGDVHPGDMVTMDVLEDFRIKGVLAIPRGALVIGHVTEAKGARKMGRGGKLTVEFETLTAGDGTKVPVSGDQTAKGKGGYGGGSAVGVVATSLVFWPAAPLFLLKHGHASVIPVGTIIAVHVTQDTSVFAIQIPVAAGRNVPTAKSIIPVTVISTTTIQNTTASDVPTESVADAARRARAEKALRDGKPQI